MSGRIDYYSPWHIFFASLVQIARFYKGGKKVNNFVFAGMDTVELAKKYGTPLYIMSENYIRDRINEIKEDF